jgi:hypothetical protein
MGIRRILCDLTKGFVRVNHEILIAKWCVHARTELSCFGYDFLDRTVQLWVLKQDEWDPGLVEDWNNGNVRQVQIPNIRKTSFTAPVIFYLLFIHILVIHKVIALWR